VGARPVAFVINRAAARQPGRLRTRCREVAKSNGWEPIVLDSAPEEGDWGEGVGVLTRRLVAAGVQLVFAVGGDGTVGACAQALAGTGASLAIVPRGAANLAAHALGVPYGLEAALAVGFGGYERRIDLAVCNGRSFIAMAGMGLDAVVVQATSSRLKQHLGWIGYAVAGVSCLQGQPHEFEIRLDGGEPLTRRAHTIVVGNVGILPGGFVLLPGARLDDGFLDVGVVAPEGTLDWALLASRVLVRQVRLGGVATHSLDGRQHRRGWLEHYQAHEVEVRADVEVPREIDGEMVGPGRSLSVGLHREALTVRVPPTRPGSRT